MPSHIPKKIQSKHKSHKKRQSQHQKDTDTHAQFTSQFDNDSLDSMLEKVLEYKTQDNMKNALKLAKLAYSKHQDSEDAFDMLCELYFENNMMDQCVNLLRRGVEKFPDTGAQKYLMLAEIETAHDSLARYRKAIEIMRRDLETMQREMQQDGMEGVEDVQAEMEPMLSAVAEAYCSIADLYMTDLSQQEDAEEGCVKALEEAQKFTPNSSHVLQTLASCRISQQKFDEARQIMLQMLQHSPDFVDTPDQFKIISGQILIELNMMNEACAVFQELRRAGEMTPEIGYLSGVAEKLNNNYLKALKLFYKILHDAHGKFRSSIKAEIMDCRKQGGEALKQQWAAYEAEQKQLEQQEANMDVDVDMED